jgi:hypothetical protein
VKQLRARWKDATRELLPLRGAARSWATKASSVPADDFLRALGGLEGVPPDYSLTALRVLEGAWTHPWAVPHALSILLDVSEAALKKHLK